MEAPFDGLLTRGLAIIVVLSPPPCFVAAFYTIVAAKNLIAGGKNANDRHLPEITFLPSW